MILLENGVLQQFLQLLDGIFRWLNDEDAFQAHELLFSQILDVFEEIHVLFEALRLHIDE